MSSFNDWLYWRQVFGAFALPPAGPMLVVLAGFVLRRWLPRSAALLVLLGFGSLWALATPALVEQLEAAIQPAAPFDRSAVGSAGAIVVLGGGLRPGAPEYGGFTINQLTTERLRYGVRLARETGLPVLLSGGVTRPRWPAEADVMAEVMKTENQLEPRWLERRSRNTRQNAQFSAEMLIASGVARIVLVTHGVDLARGRREFEARGIQVVPAPTVIARLSSAPYELRDFLPSVHALRASYYLFYEIFAAVVNGDPPRPVPAGPQAARAR